MKFAGFDVETYGNDNKFLMCGLYFDNKYLSFYDQEEFYYFLKTAMKGYTLVATNLAFDLTATFLNTKHWDEFVSISNGGMMLSSKNKKLKIQFMDTLSWHKASVKQLGEIVGIPKLEHPTFLGQKPKNEEETNILNEYNKADCEISCKFAEWFQDTIISLGGKLKITIASTSLDVWRRNFQTQVLIKEDEVIRKQGKISKERLKDKIFKAYYGGRTEVLQRGTFKNLNYYDFNSLYPSVMLGNLPLPNSVSYLPKGSLTSIFNREGVSEVTIEYDGDELPLLPYRQDGKLLFPKGIMRGYWTHVELRTAIKFGYKLHEVHETIEYSMSFMPFNDYISKLYAMRLKAKKNKSSEQIIYKLLMNSLYGKFGEKMHKVTFDFDFNTISEEELKTLKEEHYDKDIKVNDDGKAYFTFDEECNSAHIFPILPTYITALGRIKLWDVARKHNPVYMDTDSIITEDTLPFSNKIGELDCEYRVDNGIFIKPKMYMFTDGEKEIVKLKGVPRITREKMLEVLKGNSVSYTKFVKLKEGIRRNIAVNSMIQIKKNIDLEDSKRIWDKPFSIFEKQKSIPIIIGEVGKDETDIIQNKSYASERGCITHDITS